MGGNPYRCIVNYNMQQNYPQSDHRHQEAFIYDSYGDDHDLQEFPESWSQLLMGGLAAGNIEAHKLGLAHNFQLQSEKPRNWEDQILNMSLNVPFDVKQEMSQFSNNSTLYGQEDQFHAFTQSANYTNWTQISIPVTSPRSCITTTSLSPNLLDFSYNNKSDEKSTQQPDHSSECNSTASDGVSKKARVQSSSSQPPLKVKKEKLGERVTALHQIVSPFGKTDTASVLLETIGYIRFLHAQIQALSSPYLGNAPPGNMRSQHSGLRDLPKPKELRSVGLCLVPVAFTQYTESEIGADYWAPATGGIVEN